MSKFAAQALGKDNPKEYRFIVGFNFWFLLGLALVVALGFLLLIPLIASRVNAPPHLFQWGAAIILLTSLHLFFKRLFLVRNRVKTYALLEVICSLVFFASLFLCLHLGYHDSLLLPLVLQMGLFLAGSLWVFAHEILQFQWFRDIKFYKGGLAELFRYALITGTGTALSSVSLHIFTLVLGGVADLKSVGHFSLIRSTVEPGNYVFRIVGMVNFPKMAYFYGKGDFLRIIAYVKTYFIKFLGLVSLVFLPVIFASPTLANLLFQPGSRATGQALLLAAMLAMIYLRTVSVFHQVFLNATRYPHIPGFAAPLSVLSVIPFIPVVFAQYGLGGLGMLILAAELVRFSIIMIMGELKLKELR